MSVHRRKSLLMEIKIMNAMKIPLSIFI
jgi:hypothetical protein